MLRELLTPLGISVETDVCVVSKPKADIILLRRKGLQWNDQQKLWLADGLRDTAASHLLIEFKYTESLSEASFIQVLGYDQFYLKRQKLERRELQSVLISSKTPTSGILERLGFELTDKKGVYASVAPLAHLVRVILPNELADTPNNAVLKCFASRREEWQKAFATIRRYGLFRASWALGWLISGLWRILMKQLVPDPEVEGWTPENVMQLGQEWFESMIEATPAEEVMKRYKPKDRVTGLNIKERLAGLGEQEVILAGERKGKASTLLSQLQRRFGELSNETREKISNADLPTLEEWSLRILDAKFLEDVFADDQDGRIS